MKKSISFILCLSLVLCSLFSIGSVAFAAEVSTAENVLSVWTPGVYNDTITYTVYLKPGVSTAGAIVKAVYDPNVLQPVSAGQAAGSTISGFYTAGQVYGSNNAYSVAYMNMSDYKNGTSNNAFMQFTFRVVDSARPHTNVSFYCDQFDSDSQPSLNINKGDYEPFMVVDQPTLGVTCGIKAEMFEGGVTVTWEPTESATGYIVYKVVDGLWKEIATVTDGTSYVDYAVANNNVYQYTVRAVNGYGLNSGFEQGASVCYLIAPSALWLNISGINVIASWPAVDGISSYNLYRRTINVDGSKGAWVYVDTTDRTSLIDSSSSLQNWNNYEYSVCSVSGNNVSPQYRISAIQTYAKPDVTLVLGNDGVWYCYTNGAVNYDYSGLVGYNNEWFYVKNGVVDWSYTGITYYNGEYYYVEGGRLNWGSVITLSFYNGAWYCVENGKINWWYTGLVFYNNEWYYVENGVLNLGATTLTNYNGVWYYVENGKVNWNSDTLVFYDGSWYCTKYGEVAWWYTGLMPYNGEWFYVQNGVIDWSVTTLTNYNDTWYYVENGKINWNSDTLVWYEGNWYCTKYGEVAWWYTGLVFYSGEWYYVQDGVLNFGVTTLTNYNGTWYYVEESKVNWNSDTLVFYDGKWYCTKYGEVAWWYTGLELYEGKWYYVENGEVNWDCDTLVFYDGAWYSAKYGEIAWWYTGLAQYNGNLYYVENGVVDFSYTGSFTQDGIEYDIVNGEVVK